MYGFAGAWNKFLSSVHPPANYSLDDWQQAQQLQQQQHSYYHQQRLTSKSSTTLTSYLKQKLSFWAHFSHSSLVAATASASTLLSKPAKWLVRIWIRLALLLPVLPSTLSVNLTIGLHSIVYIFISCYCLSKFLSISESFNHRPATDTGPSSLLSPSLSTEEAGRIGGKRFDHIEGVSCQEEAEVDMTYLPVDVIVDQKGKERHKIDTLNLLAYVVLLVIVLLTTWYFKRRRRLLIHETGLAIIYGMVLGAALRYIGLEVIISSVLLDDQTPQTVPHDYVIVRARNLGDKNANQSHYYAYEFRGELQYGAKLGSQISYASVNPEVFFNIILPPIVLNAGLSLKRRHFFRNIGAIFSYAFIGTTISVAFVGSFIFGSIQLIKSTLGYAYLADQFSLANCLYFGAIISPTDPLAVLSIFTELGVDVNLFALVFGESILNDAVSIVLTSSIDQFSIIYGRDPYYPLVSSLLDCVASFAQMFCSSCLLGVLFGVISAITTKFTKLSETPLLETSLVVLTSYSSFLTAEVIDASGIVAILLCGITQAHYTINNLSFDARERLKNLFELLTFVCENFLFLAVGVALWQRDQTWNLPFIGLAFVACIIARAISIYPLTWLLNLGRRNKISSKFQHVIAWGGAARGVISYSLAAKNTVGDARRIMLSTTSAIVVFSVILVGSSVDMLLKNLGIPVGNHSNEEDDAGAEIMVGALGNSDGKRLIGAIDNGTSFDTGGQNWCLRPRRPLCYGSNGSSGTAIGHQTTPNSSRSISHHMRHNQARYYDQETPVIEVAASGSGWQATSRQLRQQRNHSADDLVGSQQFASVSQALQQQDRLPILAERRDSYVPNSPCKFDLQGAESGTLQTERQSLSMELGNTSHLAGSGSLATNAEGVRSASRCSSSSSAAIVQVPPAYENATLVRRWRDLDNNFIKPLLTNSHPTLMETMPASLQTLARWLTSEEQMMRRASTRN